MASLVLSGDTSGSITVSAPAVAGSTTQTLVNVTGTLAPIVSGTAQNSTSGTSIDFTGIPSWVKRITVMFSGVSTNGTSSKRIQLGDSGGFESSGYLGTSHSLTTGVGGINFTSGFDIYSIQAADVIHGAVVINLLNATTNMWTLNGNFGHSDAVESTIIGGSKSLSDTLTQVRITTVNGTDTFDAGTINIIYE